MRWCVVMNNLLYPAVLGTLIYTGFNEFSGHALWGEEALLALALFVLYVMDYAHSVSEGNRKTYTPGKFLADLVIVTRPNYSRAMDVEVLAAEVRQQHGSVETTGNVAAAIALARHRAAPEDLVLITGSLYVVGDARAEFSGPDLDAPALAGLKG